MPTPIPENITEKGIPESLRLFEANHAHTFSVSTIRRYKVEFAKLP